MPDTRVTNGRFRKPPFVQSDLSIPVTPDAKIKSFASSLMASAGCISDRSHADLGR